MHLSEETAKHIINLNPYPDKDIIDPDIAERQFQVILKGFNFLLQEENNCLYIGDEVGLGKTYIALGIASLLRHFSHHPERYIDTVIVPKANLQYKWQKEIRNFVTNNYILEDNIVKSILKQPVAQFKGESIKDQLSLFSNDHPAYYIYRNSSFSIASENEESDSGNWIQKLTEKLEESQRPLFEEISRKFRSQHHLIKRAFGYLFNASLPEIDLLIVDEAHNFRHGIGNDVSIRNQLVSRIFGAVSEDAELTEVFPQLKDLSKPKVKKLLLLSATPLNSSLHEIKRQMDCFLPNHIFSNVDMNDEGADFINKNLNNFLIRGVMNIKIKEKEYSRNGYRHEHRAGNVIMQDNAKPQTLSDDATALVLSLMQYKTIKELKLKSGSMFEMGMLAGFESFHKNSAAYEDDTLNNRKEREAKDEQVLKEIIDSYYEEFSDYPPHPKQETLVNELFALMMKREKSLVFVRRIASVKEIERKLLKKYTELLISKIKQVTTRNTPAQITGLLQSYEDEALREKIESALDLLEDRLMYERQLKEAFPFDEETTLEETLSLDLRNIYYSLVDNPDIIEFKDKVKAHAGLKIVRTELKEVAISLLKKKWEGSLIIRDEDEEDDQNSLTEEREDEERAPYFFQRFFYNEGKSFKNKSYRKDWYEINLLLINEKYGLFPHVDWTDISKEYDFFTKEKTDIAKFQKANELILRCIKNKKDEVPHADIFDSFKKETFLTTLLINLCPSEFSKWIEYYRKQINEASESAFISELNMLTEIIKSIFRQGSGLIPAFIADARSHKSDVAFIKELSALLEGEFSFVLDEIKQVILDYEKLIERNFDNKDKISYNLIQQIPVAGISGHHKRNVRKTAIQFRMPGYPYVLITTDILKEGEDLHSYCKNIYHYGIAWNPSDMEQRTGRIDRIDSLAYKALKNIEKTDSQEIPFDNKLQVFYPYLADTLEVNQMTKLFKDMDNFIDVFYNDLSASIEKDSKASINDVVTDIPAQRQGLLISKYDHQAFSPVYNGTALNLHLNTQLTTEELLSNLEKINKEIKVHQYIVSPEFDKSNFALTGIMNLDGRHGPFKLYFKQDLLPGKFICVMESLLGRSQVLGKSSNKEKIREEMEHYAKESNLYLLIKEVNSYVYLTIQKSIDEDPELIAKDLYDLVKATDEIEEKVLGTDEKPE